MKRLSLFVAIGGGCFALAVALLFQYVGGLPPCDLCMEQRWGHLAAIAAGLLALVLSLRDDRLSRIALMLSALGYAATAGLAVYHAGVEQKWWLGPQACTGGGNGATTIEDLRRALASAPIIRCDEIPWSFLGISMAGYDAILCIALAAFLAFLIYRDWKSA